MRGEVHKQFLELVGKPILAHTLEPFEHCDQIDEIIVVAPKDWLFFVAQDVVDRFEFQKVLRIVEGGQERQDSVRSGLQAVESDVDVVVIHDAVRPFVTPEMIARGVRGARECSAVTFAVRPRDTVKVGEGDVVESTLSRDELWLVQTPQAFRLSSIRRAYEAALKDNFYATDDAALVERLGGKVTILEGDYRNFKITTSEDLELARWILEARGGSGEAGGRQ